jgi:hypothetical protein
MRKIIFAVLCVALLSTVAFGKGRTRVKTYTKRNGTRVQSHQRTTPNRRKGDNWSSVGNTNPNTGKRGSKKY